MPTRERKRKVCSCCETSAVTSSQPKNTMKRRRIQKGTMVAPEPEIVNSQVGEETLRPPVIPCSVEQPKSLPLLNVFGCLQESDEDVIYESTGHSTRRIKHRTSRTVRGKDAVHTFIKEITYTFASTKVSYVGQELLPCQGPNRYCSLTVPEMTPETSRQEGSLAALAHPLRDSVSDSDRYQETGFLPSFRENDSKSSDSDSASSDDYGHDKNRTPQGSSDSDSSDSDSDSGRDNRNGFGPNFSDSYSADSDSDSDAESGCCLKHRELLWGFCSCTYWCSCPYENRPLPSPCPKEMNELLEALLTVDPSKQEYEILQVVQTANQGACVYLYNKTLLNMCRRQTLRLDRTVNLGACYVTAFVFRNSNLIYHPRDGVSSDRKYGPLMTGPVMLHFDKDSETYTRFFETIREKVCISKEPLPESEVNNMKGVLKKDRLITKTMREVFGSNMSLTDNHHVPVRLRTALKSDVRCRSPIGDAVKSIFEKMKDERRSMRFAVMECVDTVSLHPHVKHFLRKRKFANVDEQLEFIDRVRFVNK